MNTRARLAPLVMLAIALPTVALPVAIAQSNALSIERAVSTALSENLEVANAQNALRQARTTQAARDNDPTALITEVLQARQGAELSQVQLQAVRLEVASDTVNDFLNLAENTDTLQYLQSQTRLSERNLEIAKARLNARTATPVDVQRAETELAGARQQLADAKAQRPIITARLGRLLGLEKGGEPVIGEPPTFRARSVNLAQLEEALPNRAAQVVQAAQAVEFSELIVKTSDNDYTPEQSKREARTNLENARRALNTATRRALTQLRDAHRSVQDALEGIKVANQNRDTTARTAQNDRVRLQNGLIAKVQLEASELSAQKAELDAVRASNGYLRALAALSLAAGNDTTGLVK